MSLVTINWNPSNRQVRQFGILSAIALPLIAWCWSADSATIGVLAIVGIALATMAFLYPPSIKPIFFGLMFLTIPIGIVLGELAMLLIYGLVFLPIGIMFRLLGRDRLQLKLDRQAASYWQPKARPQSVAKYYHQS